MESKVNPNSQNAKLDVLALVLRLSGEDDASHAPETLEVLMRWRPALDAVLAGKSREEAVSLVMSDGPAERQPPQRYEIDAIPADDGYHDPGADLEVLRSDTGDWVKWDDVASLFATEGRQG